MDDPKMVEPLRIENESIVDSEGQYIGYTYNESIQGISSNNDTSNSRARRIVACVNACAGASIEDLERLATMIVPKGNPGSESWRIYLKNKMKGFTE